MLNKPIVRAVLFFALILVLRVSIINGLDAVNTYSTSYINAINNEVVVNNFNSIYSINNLTHSKGLIRFVINSDNNEYILFVRNLTFYHEIHVNDKVYSQNISKNESNFDSSFAYKIINVKGITDVKIMGNSLEKLEFFIAQKDVMNTAIEKRTIFYTINLMTLFLLVLFFIVMFIYDSQEKYFLVFILIGVTSIIKSIALGELPYLASLINVNISNYNVYGNITTIINTLLPIVILLNLFEIKVSKKYYRYIFIMIIIIGTLLVIDFNKNYKNIYIILSTISMCIYLYAASYKKKYYKEVLFLNGVLYFSLVMYALRVMNKTFKPGVLSFYTNTAYIGAIVYLIGFTIVFIKIYQNRINESIKKEKEFERIILLRGISHDLKLPLSVIKISSQMIESNKLNQEQITEYAYDITQEVNILEKMTDNINAYLKLGYKDSSNYLTSVKTVFNRIEKDFNLINYKGKYDFKVIHDSKDYFVNVDELELYRVLYNLLDNSFKYCNNNDTITVRYEVQNKLYITVQDTGVGIETNKINKIFSQFYRIDDSRNKEGLGLGLSVVKGLIDKWGGSISVKSELGKGTTITILI